MTLGNLMVGYWYVERVFASSHVCLAFQITMSLGKSAGSFFFICRLS